MGLAKYLQAAVSRLFRGKPIETKVNRRASYNPRQHVNFYVVGGAVIQHLLNDPSPKTARQFSESIGYAESTLRTVCKLLVAEDTLTRVQEFPASYRLSDEQTGREKLAQFKEISG